MPPGCLDLRGAGAFACEPVLPMAQHILAEHHFSQTGIGGANWINLGWQNRFTEVGPASAAVANHELKSRLDGIAAAVMEASRRIREQYRAARITEFNHIFSIGDRVNFPIADAVTSPAAPIAQGLRGFL